LTYIKGDFHVAAQPIDGSETAVLNWISENIFRLIGWIPNWLYADDTPRYYVVRGFLGVLLLVSIILAVAIWKAQRAAGQGEDG
jgi:hypothetical protein